MTEVIIKNGDDRKYDLPVGTIAIRQNTDNNGIWDGEKAEKTGEGAWSRGGGTVSPFPSGDFHIQNPQLVIELLLIQVDDLKIRLQRSQGATQFKQGQINDIISFITGEDEWKKVEEEA